MSTIKESATICDLDYLLFPVEVRDEEMPSNSEYRKRIVGQVNGGDFLLNQCSPRYELVPNADVFPNIEKVLTDNGISFTAVYRHIDHVRFYADYIITDSRYGYKMKGTNDTIQPKIMVQHSYNGLTKYKIHFGYFRLICSNGLVIPVQEMNEYNLVIVGKHTESIKRSFAELDEMLKNFAANARQVVDAITDKYELLGGRWVANVDDRVKEVLNASKINIIDNKNFNTVNFITNVIAKESNTVGLGYNGKVNDWLIYNAINQYINNDDLNIAAPEKRFEKDSTVFEYILENA